MATETLRIAINASGGAQVVGESAKAKSGLSSIEKQAKTTTSAIGGAGGGMLKFIAATAGIATVGVLVKKAGEQFVDFNKDMRNVNSIAQLSEKQFKGVSDAVLRLAGPTAQAPSTLAAGMYDLVSSGFTAHQSVKLVGVAARAATAGITTTDVAVKGLSAVLNAYQMPASKATAVSDALFQTVNLGVIHFDELANNIGNVLPYAAKTGISLREVGAVISTMTKQGIGGANSITFLKNSIVSFLNPSKAMKKAIKETGFESGEALVKSKGFEGALHAVASTTDGSSAALQKLFPNIRSSIVAMALSGKTARMAASDFKHMRDSHGATATALAQQSKSIAFQWNRLKAEAGVLAIQGGQALEPFAAGVLHATGGMLHLVPTLVQSRTAMTALAVAAGMLAGRAGALAGIWAVGKIGAFITMLGEARAALALFAETGSIAAFATGEAGLMAIAGPIGLIAGGALAAAAALGAFSGNELSAADAARQVTAALQGQRSALDSLEGASLSVAEAKHQVQSANTQVIVAERAYHSALQQSGRHSLAARQALDGLRTARDQQARAALTLGNNEFDLAKKTNAARVAADKTLGVEGQQIVGLMNLRGWMQRHNATGAQMAAINNRIASSSAKLANDTAKASPSVQALARNFGRMPKTVTTILRVKDGQTRSLLAGYANDLIKLGKQKAVAKIVAETSSPQAKVNALKHLLDQVHGKTARPKVVADTGSSKQKVDQVRQSIDNLHDKTVKVNVVTTKSKGRATGGRVQPGEALTLVGERGPELVSLPVGSFVHTASQTRGMLGVQAFANGGVVQHPAAIAKAHRHHLSAKSKYPNMPASVKQLDSLWAQYGESRKIYENTRRGFEQSPVAKGMAEIGQNLDVGEADSLVDNYLTPMLTMLQNSITAAAQRAKDDVDAAIKKLDAILKKIDEEISTKTHELHSLQHGKNTKRKQDQITRVKADLSKLKARRKAGGDRRGQLKEEFGTLGARLSTFSAADSILQEESDTSYDIAQLTLDKQAAVTPDAAGGASDTLAGLLAQQLESTQRELAVLKAQNPLFVGSFKTGGIVPATGFAYVHEGEHITPKEKVGTMRPVEIHIHGDRALAAALADSIELVVDETQSRVGGSVGRARLTPSSAGRLAGYGGRR